MRGVPKAWLGTAYHEVLAQIGSVDLDPTWVAEIAERLKRPVDARKWLTTAAKHGDTEAMRRLIADFACDDLRAIHLAPPLAPLSVKACLR